MQVQHCFVNGQALQSAPQLRLVQGLDVADRDSARSQARAALRSCLAPELGCAEAQLEISNLRNQPPQLLLRSQMLSAPYCSISHAPGIALLAWHWRGAVGVDIQAVAPSIPRHELEDVARLFFQPNKALALMGIAQDALFFERFAQAWTQQEAQLKCAGLGLVEWSAALQARLAALNCASPVLADGLDGYAAAVAWTGASSPAH